MGTRKSVKDASAKVAQTLQEAGFRALFAGGCVRDALLGLQPKDYDVATDARPEQITKLFRRTEEVGAKFGVVIVRLHGRMVEVATFRTDVSYSDGRHPDQVRFTSPAEDAQRRDFTINGMFYDPQNDEVIDYVGGQDDLKAKIIRAIGKPADRFREDYLRMLRAVRFAARFGFAIEPQTREGIVQWAASLQHISAERIREELERMLEHHSRGAAVQMMADLGLLEHLWPDAAWPGPARTLAIETLRNLSADSNSVVAMAALLGGVSGKQVGPICRHLRFSNYKCARIRWLCSSLPSVRQPDALSLADLKLLMAKTEFPALADLLRATLLAEGLPDEAHKLLIERADAVAPAEIAPDPLVTGDDLLAMNIPQGPTLGKILNALYRAQLDEEITDRRQALERARQLVGQTGEGN